MLSHQWRMSRWLSKGYTPNSGYWKMHLWYICHYDLRYQTMPVVFQSLQFRRMEPDWSKFLVVEFVPFICLVWPFEHIQKTKVDCKLKSNENNLIERWRMARSKSIFGLCISRKVIDRTFKSLFLIHSLPFPSTSSNSLHAPDKIALSQIELPRYLLVSNHSKNEQKDAITTLHQITHLLL